MNTYTWLLSIWHYSHNSSSSLQAFIENVQRLSLSDPLQFNDVFNGLLVLPQFYLPALGHNDRDVYRAISSIFMRASPTFVNANGRFYRI